MVRRNAEANRRCKTVVFRIMRKMVELGVGRVKSSQVSCPRLGKSANDSIALTISATFQHKVVATPINPLSRGRMATILDYLAVKIILLGIVNNIPEAPRLNVSQQDRGSEKRRTLSLKHEACIAQQLAFICSYSGDPLHVLAVCVEEVIPRNGIIIRLAANTGEHEALVDGLKKITRVLQNEATNGSSPSLG